MFDWERWRYRQARPTVPFQLILSHPGASPASKKCRRASGWRRGRSCWRCWRKRTREYTSSLRNYHDLFHFLATSWLRSNFVLMLTWNTVYSEELYSSTLANIVPSMFFHLNILFSRQSVMNCFFGTFCPHRFHLISAPIPDHNSSFSFTSRLKFNLFAVARSGYSLWFLHKN